ncbi:MAG: Mg-protoporphyrin IX monomethyl ester oxidative cyclase, partial [uncultured bacterium]
MNANREHLKIVGLNARFTHSCLALFYVRNELARYCPEMAAEICQFTINDNYYEMVVRLTEGSPRYVFFSAAIWNSILIERLTRDLRTCLPRCRVVIG